MSKNLKNLLTTIEHAVLGGALKCTDYQTCAYDISNLIRPRVCHKKTKNRRRNFLLTIFFLVACVFLSLHFTSSLCALHAQKNRPLMFVYKCNSIFFPLQLVRLCYPHILSLFQCKKKISPT